MKEITKEIVTKQTVFVAVDGTEFNSAEDCKKWEKSYEGIVTNEFKKLNVAEVNCVDLGIPFAQDYYSGFAIYIDSIETATTVLAYCNMKADEIYNEEAVKVGATIIAATNYDNDFCEFHDADENIKRLMDSYNKLNGSIRPKKAESNT